MAANSSSLRSDGKRKITLRSGYENPTAYVTRSKAIAIDKEREGRKISLSFYLIYGVGCGFVAGVADFRGVLCDRMIADCTVVAYDEAQQAYL